MNLDRQCTTCRILMSLVYNFLRKWILLNNNMLCHLNLQVSQLIEVSFLLAHNNNLTSTYLKIFTAWKLIKSQ